MKFEFEGRVKFEKKKREEEEGKQREIRDECLKTKIEC